MSAHFTQDFVTVHNRTTTPREVRFDGQTGIIPPHPAIVQMSRIAADRAFQQNRIPGTEDPYNPADFQSYIGIAEWQPRCPIDPIGVTTDKIEALDRSLLPPDRQKTTTVQHGRARGVERANIGNVEDTMFRGDHPS